MNFVKKPLLLIILLSCQTTLAEAPLLEEMLISERLFKDTTRVSPSSAIGAEDLKSINMMTAEDAVAHEPSLVIRRRFIGDANGTMGLRGSGMFQTARSMVFADGLPLHYLLQTRWSGAPRWSLVAPNEIEKAEVIYGPFSAEYSGNAMGGVVNVTTRIPDQRRMTLQGNVFSQQYNVLATDENYNGGKVFASYEDRLGDLSIYTSLNHLKNHSQPMSNYMVSIEERGELDAAGVSGYFEGVNDRGEDVLYIGDSGAETAVSDLYKVKLNYDFGNAQLRTTIAYENRKRDEDDKNNYLLDANGATYWGVGNRNFENRSQERDSLLLGLGLSGDLSSSWFYDIFTTDFSIKKDAELRSGLNPNDPNFGERNGRLTEQGNTAWQTFDAKLGTESLLGSDAMRLSIGYSVDAYTLEIASANIDATNGRVASDRPGSGGETSSKAVFAQWGLAFADNWDVALGLRYEDWKSQDGYLGDDHFEDRKEDGLSPKFSLAFMGEGGFSIRYSAAKAFRFPIVEELYSNESRTANVIVSDPGLEPEEGFHQNLSLTQDIENGYLRVNIFHEILKNTIYNQSGTIIDGGLNVNVSTFLAVDEVKTRGLEFVYNQGALLGSQFRLRFNATHTDAQITRNRVNPDIEGNAMPRIPEWRANVILSYPLKDTLDISSSIRYASDTFGDLDNKDNVGEVYGAIDDYLFVNAKANWSLAKNKSLALGLDNIFNDLAYVAHPWPSRTLYLEGKISF